MIQKVMIQFTSTEKILEKKERLFIHKLNKTEKKIKRN